MRSVENIPERAGRGPVIAIDGPSGVGKTTVSRLVAETLGFRYVDTGAMYRAMALAAFDAGVDIEDIAAAEGFCSDVRIVYDTASGAVSVNGIDYTAHIRTRTAADIASIFSRHAPVRSVLVEYQREIGKSGSIVMEGRDIGTAVFPGADLKFYLDAEHSVRARRRHVELPPGEAGEASALASEMEERDRRDKTRRASPLKIAGDALYIDTTGLDIKGVVGKVMGLIKERLKIGDNHR